MKKKILALAMAVMIVASFTATVSATEAKNPYALPYDVNTGEMFDSSVSSAVSNLTTREFVGVGTLYHDDPLFGKPEAYAYTEAYSSSYKVRAKCSVNNNGESTATTGWKELNDTIACNSGTIQASTAKCSFTGYHEIQVTSTSPVGSAQTYAYYD